MNKGYKALGALQCVLISSGLTQNATKVLCEEVVAPKLSYEAEILCMRSAER